MNSLLANRAQPAFLARSLPVGQAFHAQADVTLDTPAIVGGVYLTQFSIEMTGRCVRSDGTMRITDIVVTGHDPELPPVHLEVPEGWSTVAPDDLALRNRLGWVAAPLLPLWTAVALPTPEQTGRPLSVGRIGGISQGLEITGWARSTASHLQLTWAATGEGVKARGRGGAAVREPRLPEAVLA